MVSFSTPRLKPDLLSDHAPLFVDKDPMGVFGSSSMSGTILICIQRCAHGIYLTLPYWLHTDAVRYHRHRRRGNAVITTAPSWRVPCHGRLECRRGHHPVIPKRSRGSRKGLGSISRPSYTPSPSESIPPPASILAGSVWLRHGRREHHLHRNRGYTETVDRISTYRADFTSMLLRMPSKVSKIDRISPLNVNPATY